MNVVARGPHRNGNASRWLAFAPLPIVVPAVGVLVTGTGVDVLLFVAACVALVVYERTVGDWLADVVGTAGAMLLLLAAVGSLAWLTVGGTHPPVHHVLKSADRLGYSSLYVQIPSSAGTTAPASASPPVQTVAAGGASTIGSRSVEPRRSVPSSGSPRAPADAPTGNVESGTTRTSLTISPLVIAAGEQVTFRASVSAPGQRVTSGSVEFLIDGSPAGRALVDAGGLGSLQWSTTRVGRYHVRAVFSGTVTLSSSSSTTAVLVVRERLTGSAPEFSDSAKKETLRPSDKSLRLRSAGER